MSAEAWSATIAAIAAVWAVWANTLEWRRTRFLKGIEMLNSYADQFSGEYRVKRHLAATYLLNDNFDPADPPEALVDILDFFECIAYLNRKNLLDHEAIWHFFASWLLPYVAAADPVIKHMARDDPTLFEDLCSLYKALEKIEQTRHPSKNALHIVSPTSIKGFLAAEAS